MKNRRQHNAGFTLIEIMIVVEIIGIIVAIGLPQMLRARVQSNEMGAVTSLRAILDAQISYHTANNEYASEISELTSATPPFLNGDWDGPRAGYNFEMQGTPNNFTALANPESPGVSGFRGYYVDPSGIIRYALSAKAGPDSTALGS
ncbi:MAG: prepilin-type N-terminal cleavage/methylation domain-containing protein [Candidatus Hydrogenedentota bacterium]